MAFTLITQGSFTSTGVGQKVILPSSADYFKVTNLTQMATTQNPGRGVVFEWYGGGLVADGAAIEYLKTNSTNALNATVVSSGGFTYVTTAPTVEAQAANAITGITAASPAVVSQNHSYSNGDFIRIYNTTGMLQIAGMVFQISNVSAGVSYDLIGLRAAGFAAPATAGNTRRVSKAAAVDPEFLYVTEITKATQAVVRLSVDPSPFYVVGMKVRFSVPSSYGMTEINGLTGEITAISSANYTITVDINSTSFTTFAFPTSALALVSQSFATIAPAGASTQFDPNTLVQTGYDFVKQPFHTGQFTPYMYLAAGAQSPAGSTSDVIVWQAYKMESTFYS